ncbi:ribonuclease H-like domain-containing protein [Tanacetum coccineum]
MNFFVFNCSEEDSVGKPLYSRFIKTNNFKGVPHPLSGDYTPKLQEEIDESLYVYGKKGPQEPEPSVSDDRSSEYSTCQSNDSEGSIGTSSEHSLDPESEISSVPPEVYVPTPISTNEKGVSASTPKEVEPSCVSHIKNPRQPIKDQATPKVNRKNWNAMVERELGEGYSFTKKKCFVCGSLSHLIKDCDYYEKKMAKEAEVKKQRVCNTGNMMAKPVWTNTNRINHANQFVPRPVQLNTGRPNINSVRTNINSVRPRVNTVNTNVNTVRFKQPVPTRTSNSFSPKRPQVNQFNQRKNFSKSYSSVRRPFAKITAQMSHSNAVKGKWGSAVKTSAGYNWRNSKPNSNCDSGPTFIRTDHPLKNMVDRGIFDSGCSGHMTGNKDQLEDFKEFNGGSVTFGGSKGYISGKGKIRVGNLDFDSVSFVKELGHFNLFSISQICDKQHKTPTPAKGFACLIAKATSDESKLWHRRNYITVSLENQANPHVGASEVTNSACTSQTPYSNASEERDEDVELIVVPSKVMDYHEKQEREERRRRDKERPEKKNLKPAEKQISDEFYGRTHIFLRITRSNRNRLNFISQDKYVAEILKKFDLVTPKTSHLNAVKRIFKYLKGKPHLGLWYPRESPFDLEAFSDSDYGGSNLDRLNSIKVVVNFLRQRLISWQCKKQTIVATSTTEAEYVAAANCCGQVLWVQNQLLDYGFNFMNTKIHIDNESTICIVKNPRYALTSNPTIYDSLVKQFWQTATAKTLADGTLELHATIDTMNMKGGFEGHQALLTAMLACYYTNHSAGQDHPDVLISQPSSSTILYHLLLTTRLVTPSKTTVNASGREQIMEEYKRWKETKGEGSCHYLDFQEDVSTGMGRMLILASIPSPDKGQREGKDPMIIKEAPKKTKEQSLQEEASLAEAIRLDTLEKEERGHKDWDLIRAKIEDNAEFSKSVLGSGLTREDLQRSELSTLKNQGTWKLSQLKNLSFEEVKEEFDKLVKQVESFAPINFEATKDSLKIFGEELQAKTSKRLKSDEAKDDESTKKTVKRRKQIARKGLHSEKTDEDESEANTSKERSIWYDMGSQRLSATTVTEKGILLENVDLEEIKGEELMVTMAGAITVNYALMAISSSSLSSSSDGKINKNLDEILNSQMSARDKTGLGYSTQLNELSSNHETDSENSLSIFDARSSDEDNIPKNDRFSENRYKAVPPPIIGNFLTPRANISFTGLDEYAIRNKIIESQTTKLNTKTSETVGKTNDANTEKPKSVSESVVSNPNINRDSVIIEDWNSDDEEEGYEAQTVRLETQTVRHETQTVKTRDDKSDCNFHDKKSQEPKLKNVVNTGQREGKPVWDNTKRVNHQKFSKYPHLSKTFVPSGVLTRTGLHRPSISTTRTSVSTARPVSTASPSISTARSSVSTTRPISTASPSVSTTSPSISTARPVSTTSPSISTATPVYVTRPIYPRMDNVRPRGSCSPIKRSYYSKLAFRPKDLKQDVKTFRVQNRTTAGTRVVVNAGKGKLNTDLKKSRWVWRPKGNYLDHVSKDSGSFMLKKVEYVDPKGISKSDHAVVDSGCSSHMTVNKAYLSDYEDFNGGFMSFRSDPKGGKITGKGKIKTANLDFNDVYSIDELKFNLFSVSKMCDKKNSILFTKSECLIMSPSFKLHDESQVLHRAPRKDDVYSLDLKNIVPSGERKNRTLIEAARTMLADLLLPIPFWAEAVNTACYVLNRLLVTKPKNKTPYELLMGKSPSISFMRTFGCPLTILNTLDSLGKFDGKSDEGYLLGYSTSSKAFRVYNKRTKREEKNLHINFLEDQPNVTGTGPNWMFDLDFLKISMNYIPVSVENQVHVDADSEDAANKESEQDLQDELKKMVTQELAAKAMDDVSRQAFEEEKRRIASQKKAAQATSTNKLSIDRPSVSTDRPSVSTDRPFVSTDRSNTPYVSAASTPTGANAGESSFVYLGGKIPIDASTLPNADLPIDPNMPDLEDASDTLPNDGIFNGAYDDDEDVGAVADFNNMDNTIAVSPIPTLRIHKDHPKGQILGDPTSAVQTRGKIQKDSSSQ